MPRGPETRTARRQRLLAHGRWQVFQDRRAQLIAEGKPPTEANYIADAEFGPDRFPAQVEPPKLVAPTLARAKGKPRPPRQSGKRPPTREVIEWVFEHLDAPDSTADDAPSAGAWSLLEWARGSHLNRRDFYLNFYAKLMPTRSEIDRDASDAKGEEVCERSIQKLLAIRKDAVASFGPEGPDGGPPLAARRAPVGLS